MIVVADTSAVLALLDVRAREHGVLRAEYERGAAGWLLGLRLGLVDAVVMAQAERLGAGAIATLDLRDFGAVTLRNSPALWPRDL